MSECSLGLSEIDQYLALSYLKIYLNTNFGLVLGLINASLLRVSRQYRSILRDCQEQFDGILKSDGDAETIRRHSEVLYKLELIWNLVEILFIERTPCK